jgi:hypothetical protein
MPFLSTSQGGILLLYASPHHLSVCARPLANSVHLDNLLTCGQYRSSRQPGAYRQGKTIRWGLAWSYVMAEPRVMPLRFLSSALPHNLMNRLDRAATNYG